jgi:hypothetical protein
MGWEMRLREKNGDENVKKTMARKMRLREKNGDENR